MLLLKPILHEFHKASWIFILYSTILHYIILYLVDLKNFLQSFPGFWRRMSLAGIFISSISNRSFTFLIYFSASFCIVSFYPFNLGFQMHWHILLKYLWSVFVSASPSESPSFLSPSLLCHFNLLSILLLFSVCRFVESWFITLFKESNLVVSLF